MYFFYIKLYITIMTILLKDRVRFFHSTTADGKRISGSTNIGMICKRIRN